MFVNKIKTAVTAFLVVGVLGAGVGAGGVIAQSYGSGQGGSRTAANPAAAQNANEDVQEEQKANDADLKKLQRAVEEHQRLIEEKEKELARLREFLRINKAKPPKADNPLGPGRDAELAELQRLLGQLGNKDIDPRVLNELWGHKPDPEENQLKLKQRQRAIADLETELARLRGTGQPQAGNSDARPEDPEATLKRLTQMLQQWAERNKPIEPAEVKKALGELQQGSRLKELKRRLESQQKTLQERDAELSELKQILKEVFGQLPPDAPFATTNKEPGPSGPRDAELEKLKSLLKEQDEKLRQKNDELKKLQDFLKQSQQGKPKSPNERE